MAPLKLSWMFTAWAMSSIMDVHGVGYELTIPFKTFEQIQGLEKVSLYIHTLHREEQLRLFGFSSQNEREVFRTLLNISGIGPAMAISLMSGISTERLIESVKSGNTAILTKIPGIGKSKAEKLIFELSRKIKKLEVLGGGEAIEVTPRSDAVEALMSLGFDEKRATSCVDEILQQGNNLSLEELIKEALKVLV